MLTGLVASFGVQSGARAHRGSTKHLLVEPTEDGARVRVEVEVVDVAVELGLGEDAPEAQVLADGARARAWLEGGVRLLAGEAPCAVSSEGTLERLDDEDAPRVALTLVYACGPDRPLRLRDDTIFANDAQHEAFVRLRFGEGVETQVLRRGRQEATIGTPASIGTLLARFAWEGILHLVTGYDHLLFLLALLLTSGERAVKEGRRKALRDVALVVTAFTVGHSVTLVAAALGWVVLPSRLVETVIALSIALVAALNYARPEAREPMPWIALCFGLVHGFGFSGVLAELGLPERARVLSLLSFNVGIELAQLAAVALAIGPLTWLARRPGYRRWVVRGGSIAIGLLATFWMIERATGGG
jgi:hydrogenase/urease accessory protein HupE